MTRRSFVPRVPVAPTALGLMALTLLGSGCGEVQREGSSTPLISASEGWVRAMAVLAVAKVRERSDGPEHAHPEPATAEPEEPMSGVNTAGYLVIRNDGSFPDRLLSAETDAARSVGLHRTILEGDIMRMRQVRDVPIPAGGSIELEPGGLHLMLLDLRRALAEGESVTLILHLEKAGEVVVELVVRR